MSPDVPEPIDNVPTPIDNVPTPRDTVTAKDTVKTSEDRAHVDRCLRLREHLIAELRLRTKGLETEWMSISHKGRATNLKIRQETEENNQQLEKLNKVRSGLEPASPQYGQSLEKANALMLHHGQLTYALHEENLNNIEQAREILAKCINLSKALDTVSYPRDSGMGDQYWRSQREQIITQNFSEYSEPPTISVFDQFFPSGFPGDPQGGQHERQIERLRTLECEQIRKLANTLGVSYTLEEGGLLPETEPQPKQETMAKQSARRALVSRHELPLDWTSLSRQQQQLVDQVVAANIITSSTILMADSIKRRPPKRRASKASGPKPQPRAKRPSPKGASEYPEETIRQAEQALKEARALDRAGKLPSMDEIAEWYRKKLAPSNNLTQKEAVEAETEFDRLTDARHRVDLADSKHQRIVYAAGENNVSFVRLLPDGTIHIIETEKLGPGSYRRFEEWAYLDGKRVTWSSQYEEHHSAGDKTASERVFREETIDIKQSPMLHDVFSSTVSGQQEIKDSISLPKMDTKPVESERIMEKLEELKQDHPYGPWESVESK